MYTIMIEKNGVKMTLDNFLNTTYRKKTTKTKLSHCQCNECVSMCSNCPCIPTPTEAEMMMDTGYATRMSARQCYPTNGRGLIWLLCPSIKGGEGIKDMVIFKGDCTFLKNNLCEIHDSGFKPFEARALQHDSDDDYSEKVHQYAIDSWDTPTGRKMFKRWHQEGWRGRR